MKYPSYPKYKKSGVAWLGNVPEHWEVKRLKNSADYCVSNVNKVPSENEIPVRLCNYTDVYYNDFITSDMELMETTATQEEIEKFHLQKEDVVITKDSEEWNDIAISSLVIKTSPDLICGYHLAIIRPKKEKLSGRYLLRQFQCSEVNHQFQIAATGVTRYGLPKSAIGEALVPLPPFSEQVSIADFLDRETGCIDTLIGKKQKFIELLKEKRTALISHAVTKGLNPKVKMKPSGVEWLGDVPEHWKVKRLKYILQEPLKYGANEAAELDDPELPRFVRITDVDESGNLRDETFRSLPEEIAKPFLLDEGDLLFARSGATVGKTFFYRKTWGRAAYAGYLIRARLKKSMVYPDYINFITKSSFYSQWISSILIQATIQNVSAEKYASYMIPFPSTQEQQAIADFLDRETRKIDALMAKVETAIEKLKEYRTALISAAVTGKIDVREVA